MKRPHDMEPSPITRLLPELLAITFERMENAEILLCSMTCSYWWSVIKKLRLTVDNPVNTMLVYGAKVDSLKCMRLAKTWNTDNPEYIIDPAELEQALKTANGNRKSNRVNMWDRPEIRKIANACALRGELAIAKAVIYGDKEFIELVKTWIPVENRSPPMGGGILNTALQLAALHGHIECMRLAKDGGAWACMGAMGLAALGGYLGCMKLTKKWLTDDDNRVVYGLTGDISWRKASKFEMAISRAASHGQIKCMMRAKKWRDEYVGSLISLRPQSSPGAYAKNSYKKCLNSAMVGAVRGGHIECMKLAKKWGATNYKHAMKFARRESRKECMTLLVLWWSLGKPSNPQTTSRLI